MGRISRREFLDETFFAAAMASLAASGAFAAEPAAAPARRRYGQGDKVRMAVIGVNGRGKAHLDGYMGLPDAEVVAICDVDLGIAERAAAAVEKKTTQSGAILTYLAERTGRLNEFGFFSGNIWSRFPFRI